MPLRPDPRTNVPGSQYRARISVSIRLKSSLTPACTGSGMDACCEEDDMPPLRSVHAVGSAFKSATANNPRDTARSAHFRQAVQNRVRCFVQQNLPALPPRRGWTARLHHRHSPIADPRCEPPTGNHCSCSALPDSGRCSAVTSIPALWTICGFDAAAAVARCAAH